MVVKQENERIGTVRPTTTMSNLSVSDRHSQMLFLTGNYTKKLLMITYNFFVKNMTDYNPLSVVTHTSHHHHR